MAKVVVFGAGYWGVNYIKELGGHLVAVVDPNTEALSRVAQDYSTPVFQELPSEVEFDSAIIVTPPDTHVPIALPLLEQGKYVMIEKPIAHGLVEVEQLIPYAERCMCAFIYLYHPRIWWMQHKLADRKVNHVFMRRTNDGPVRSWKDALWDLAIHDVAIATYWFGDAKNVVVTREQDWCVIRLDHSDTTTLCYSSWKGGPKVRQIEVVLEDEPARLIFDDLEPLAVSPLRHMLTTFLRRDWDFRGSVEFALKVTKVMEHADTIC